MAVVGDYDASTFVEGVWATYPPLPAGATLYQPTMQWNVIGAGVVQGQPVVPGDQLFATAGQGRRLGDNLYGDQVYGTNQRGDWTVDQVFFLAWHHDVPGPIRPPYPNAGCAFTSAHGPGGDWAPGWRIVIDAFYNSLFGSRTYGADTYGSDVYGDPDNDGTPQWVDMTRPAYRITCGDGTRDGTQSIPVTETVIEVVDQTGDWFDFGDPWLWYQPAPGTSIRVGFLSPDFEYHPVMTGQIERIEDTHDGTHPRVVLVRAFGQIMDLTVDVVGWQRPAEFASTRFRALRDEAGWRWGEGDLIFPVDGDLHADAFPLPIVVRDEMDRTIQSVGGFMDQDRFGGLRVRQWPHVPHGTPWVIADCYDDDDPDALISHSITYANDQSQLLNRVVAANTADPIVEVRGEDAQSIERFGKRGRALGYPKTGLAFASTAQTAAWVGRIVNRFSLILVHTEDVAVDTALDHKWLSRLADLDTGQAVTVKRRGVHPLTLDGVVVGFEHVISPGRWQANLHTTSTTKSY